MENEERDEIEEQFVAALTRVIDLADGDETLVRFVFEEALKEAKKRYATLLSEAFRKGRESASSPERIAARDRDADLRAQFERVSSQDRDEGLTWLKAHQGEFSQEGFKKLLGDLTAEAMLRTRVVKDPH